MPFRRWPSLQRRPPLPRRPWRKQQLPGAPGTRAPTAAPAGAAAVANAACPGNPDALGVARVVEIDTTGGPGFGFEHFKSMDFLRPGEVVLTFDDGPWPRNTPAVLAALAAHCTKAIFFPIGKHAMWQPGILKQVAAAGHTIGSHTWSHADLSEEVGCKKARTRSRRASARWPGRSGAPTVRRSSASRRCGIRPRWSPIWASAISRSSRPTSIRSTSRCSKPEQVRPVGDGEAEEVRQRHCADA